MAGAEQIKFSRAIFAGGCFWCMEPPFAKLDGVISVTPGYIGGHKVDPTYQEVCSGFSGHTEAVEIVYDPELVNYATLLEVFWMNIDPTDGDGQFCDRGSQYRSAIFYCDVAQQQLAEASKAALESGGRFDAPVVTQIVAEEVFYPAEEYHHGYSRSNPERYGSYRRSSGRDRYLDQTWGEERKKK